MMKIVSDESVFHIPLTGEKTILISNGYKNSLIDCMNSYFVSKKKTKCIVYDDDGQIMNMNDVNFIYISDDAFSFENNLEMRQKSIMNNEITEIIKSNPESFLSIEKVRKDLKSLETDDGMYKIRKILSKGLNPGTEIFFKELNISSLLQMFSVSDPGYSISEKRMIILNLLLYEHRSHLNIVFLDSVDDATENWFDHYTKNTFFIIDNDGTKSINMNYNAIILSNKDHLISSEETKERIRILSYMNHDIIKANLSLQNEKNVDLFNQYNDENSTFFLKNISQELSLSL